MKDRIDYTIFLHKEGEDDRAILVPHTKHSEDFREALKLAKSFNAEGYDIVLQRTSVVELYRSGEGN